MGSEIDHLTSIRRILIRDKSGDWNDTFVVSVKKRTFNISVDRLGFSDAYTRAVVRFCLLNDIPTEGEYYQQLLLAKEHYLVAEKKESCSKRALEDKHLETAILTSISEHQEKKKWTVF